MSETKKIIRQEVSAASELANRQIGVLQNVETDLGFRAWVGKDGQGDTTVFIAKDNAAQLTTLKLTGSSTATGSTGILKHDPDGDILGDADLENLGDVEIDSIADEQYLVYNSTSGKWENSDLVNVMNYKGTWNAGTNVPVLSDAGSGGNNGDFYIVSVAGSTEIDGEDDWAISDWIINIGAAWVKLDNTITIDDAYDNSGGVAEIAVDAGNVIWGLADYQFIIDLPQDIAKSSSLFSVRNGTTEGSDIFSLAQSNSVIKGLDLYTDLQTGDVNCVTAFKVSGHSLAIGEGNNYTDSENSHLSSGYYVSDPSYAWIQAFDGAGSSFPLLINPAGGTVSINMGATVGVGQLAVESDDAGYTAGYFEQSESGAGAYKGVHGIAASYSGIAGYFEATSTALATTNKGVYASAASQEGIGVHGYATGTLASGVKGEVTEATAHSGHFTGGLFYVDSASDFLDDIDLNGKDLNNIGTLTGNSTSINIGSDLKTDRWDGSNTNTLIGVEVAGAGNLSGVTDGVALGYRAAYSVVSGSVWSAFGSSAGYSNTTANNWSAFGNKAGYSNITGSVWSAFGSRAGYSNTVGTAWSAFGYKAGYSNTTGGTWNAFGSSAAYSNTTGSYFNAFGNGAAQLNTTGSEWCAFGHNAGRYISGGGDNVTGDDFVCIGYDTCLSADGTTNEVVIGHTAEGVGSNSVVLGNDSIVLTALKGRVGIGTTAPTATSELTVKADTNDGSTFAIDCLDSDGTTIMSVDSDGLLETNSLAGLTTYLKVGTGTTGHALSAVNDVLISGKLEVDGYAYFDADIYMDGDDIHNVDSIWGNSTYLRIGDASTTSHSLDADDDLLVTGELEVTGDVYFDGAVQFGTFSGTIDKIVQGNIAIKDSGGTTRYLACVNP